MSTNKIEFEGIVRNYTPRGSVISQKNDTKNKNNQKVMKHSTFLISVEDKDIPVLESIGMKKIFAKGDTKYAYFSFNLHSTCDISGIDLNDADVQLDEYDGVFTIHVKKDRYIWLTKAVFTSQI